MEYMTDHLLLRILDKLDDEFDRKAWRSTCKHLYYLGAESQTTLRLLNVDLLQQLLRKYTALHSLDLSSCTRISDHNLSTIARISGTRLLTLRLVRISGFTAAGMTALARGCSRLQDLDLSCCSTVGALELAAVSQLSSLRKLSLAGCFKVSDAGVGCLAAGCKQLEVLSLRGCVSITDAGICLLATNCKRLTTVDLAYTEVTDHAVECLSSNLAPLRTLNLSGCSNIGDSGLQHISSSLTELDLSRCKKVTSVGILRLGKSLRVLKLCYSTINNAIFQAISKLNALQTLNLAGCVIAGQGFSLLASGCPQLTELSLSKCKGVTDSAIASILQQCKSLTKLDLTCCFDLTEKTATTISKASGCPLLSLKVETCTILTEKSLRLLVKRCTCLEQLDLTDCHIPDSGLESVAKFQALKSLKLGFSDVSDNGISHIGRGCRNLTELDLYRSGLISDAGVASIASGCSKLRVLNLSYCSKISDASLLVISQLKHLQQLEVRGCKRITLNGLDKTLPVVRSVTEFDLKHCSIGDPGMLTLVHRFPNLQQLNLSYCPIKDDGLVGLARLRCLQNLKLVHVGNVSLDSITLTLLRCICLKKVKLLVNFKLSIPAQVHKQLEDRGCRLRWMQKPV